MFSTKDIVVASQRLVKKLVWFICLQPRWFLTTDPLETQDFNHVMIGKWLPIPNLETGKYAINKNKQKFSSQWKQRHTIEGHIV